ncbi:S1C family serine protease [Bacillus sp. 03113]|uniref:S1C family serine protease n=1 Tax=Bacillus sp. 03113 TaxID=2578211 RepID=UPI001141EAB7|nr:trypsin-like peptidase domain-containing protein [Bacillus sp. 03113]
MGYYEDENERRYRQRKSRGGYFFAGLTGVLIGAILVMTVVPKLSELNLLPYSVQPKQNVPTVEGNGQQQITKNVSLNVESNVTNAVDKAADAVVGITNIQSTSFWAENGNQEAGTGSGVIYKKADGKAYIVTNHHVVQGATELEVTLADGTKAPAALKGSDVWTDLAVIEIDAGSVKKIAEFGNSDLLKAGEPVIAIGNPLGLTFSGSVTQGIVSGVERAIPVDIDQDGIVDWQAEVLQTDAAINPGNSGGALVNINGQVIGINSMKIAQQEVEGIGLAIPINSARPIIKDLENFGEVKRPYMGVELQSVNEIPAYYQQEALKLPKDLKNGVAVKQVLPNGPASEAGLKELDVIVELDGDPILDVIALRKHLYTKKKAGDQMTVKFYRDGQLQEATLNLVEGIS